MLPYLGQHLLLLVFLDTSHWFRADPDTSFVLTSATLFRTALFSFSFSRHMTLVQGFVSLVPLCKNVKVTGVIAPQLMIITGAWHFQVESQLACHEKTSFHFGDSLT